MKKFITSKRFKNWLLLVMWCGVIFYGSSLPQLPRVEISFIDRIVKNGAHFLEYAILFILAKRAWTKEENSVWFAFIFTFIYALTDEFHQGFVPGRVPSVMDLGFDTLGMVFSFLITRKEHK
jgi:VanZ family protein